MAERAKAKTKKKAPATKRTTRSRAKSCKVSIYNDDDYDEDNMFSQRIQEMKALEEA